MATRHLQAKTGGLHSTPCLRWKSDLFTTLTRSRSIGGRSRTLPALPSAVSAVRRRRGRGKSCRSRAGKHECRHEADYRLPHPEHLPSLCARAGAISIWGNARLIYCPALGQHNPLRCKISQRSDQIGDEVVIRGARDAFPQSIGPYASVQLARSRAPLASILTRQPQAEGYVVFRTATGSPAWAEHERDEPCARVAAMEGAFRNPVFFPDCAAAVLAQSTPSAARDPGNRNRMGSPLVQ